MIQKTDKKMEETKKVCYNLLVTKQEEKLLLVGLKTLPTVAWTILRKAYNRGDFVIQNG